MLDGSQERMRQSEVIKEVSIGSNHNRGSSDTFLGSAYKAVAFLRVERALVGYFSAPISQGYTLDTGVDAFPRSNLLWQNRQLRTFACQGLLCPQAKLGKSASLLGGQFTTCAPQCRAKPAMNTPVATTFSQARCRQIALERCLQARQHTL